MTNKQTIKNKDLKENKNKVWIGDDGMVRVVVAKTLIEKDLDELMKKIKEVLEELPGKAKVLIDLSTNSIIRSSQYRKRTAEKIKDIAEDPGFEKLAMFGGNVILRTIASFIIVASGVKNIKIFGSKEEALKWLK